MAGAAPSNAELHTLIARLQVQVSALRVLAPAATAAPPAGTAPVVFANTLQTLGANNLIDYLTKMSQPYLKKGARHSMTRHLLMGSP